MINTLGTPGWATEGCEQSWGFWRAPPGTQLHCPRKDELLPTLHVWALRPECGSGPGFPRPILDSACSQEDGASLSCVLLIPCLFPDCQATDDPKGAATLDTQRPRRGREDAICGEEKEDGQVQGYSGRVWCTCL